MKRIMTVLVVICYILSYAMAQSDHVSEGNTVFNYSEEKEDSEFFIPVGSTTVDISIFYNTYVEILHVPSSCSTLMYYGYSDSSLRWIDVDENNVVYSSCDGFLYTKNGETLLFCPPAYEQDEVELPSTVNAIESGAFENTKYIKKLIIPNTVESIEGFPFENSSIETIFIYGIRTSFGIDAFNYCPNLKEIWIYQQSTADEILTEDIDYINLKDIIRYISD